MTKDSRKSNQRDFFAFVEQIRSFAFDRQTLPENARDGETFQRIFADGSIAESVALRGLKITAAIFADNIPVLYRTNDFIRKRRASGFTELG